MPWKGDREVHSQQPPRQRVERVGGEHSLDPLDDIVALGHPLGPHDDTNGGRVSADISHGDCPAVSRDRPEGQRRERRRATCFPKKSKINPKKSKKINKLKKILEETATGAKQKR